MSSEPSPPTDGTSAQPPLQSCPECGYALSGLPPAHRCPECGFVYTPDMLVFEGHRSRGFVVPVGLALLSAWGVLGLVATIVRNDLGSLACNAAVLLLVGGGWWSWARRRQAHYVVLTAADLTYYEGGAVQQRFALREIGYAEWNGVARCITLYDRTSLRLAELPFIGSEDTTRAGAICKAINARLATADAAEVGEHDPQT